MYVSMGLPGALSYSLHHANLGWPSCKNRLLLDVAAGARREKVRTCALCCSFAFSSVVCQRNPMRFVFKQMAFTFRISSGIPFSSAFVRPLTTSFLSSPCFSAFLRAASERAKEGLDGGDVGDEGYDVLSDWPGLSVKAGELVLRRLRRGRTKAEGVEGLDGGSFFVSTCSGLFAIEKEKKSQIKKDNRERDGIYLVLFVAEGASGAVFLSNGSAMPSLPSTSIRASPEEAARTSLCFGRFFFVMTPFITPSQ